MAKVRTAEQWIREGKIALHWTRLVLPRPLRHWYLTTLRDKLIKIGAKVVSHGRYVTSVEDRVTREMPWTYLGFGGQLYTVATRSAVTRRRLFQRVAARG